MTQAYTDIDLSFDELVRACGGGADWVVQLIDEEVISINGSPTQARYSSLHLARIRRAGRPGGGRRLRIAVACPQQCGRQQGGEQAANGHGMAS